MKVRDTRLLVLNVPEATLYAHCAKLATQENREKRLQSMSTVWC